MSARAAARLAWSLWAGALALVAGGLILGLATRPAVPLYAYWLESTLIHPTFATLGALIASRRPGNLIGWIFCLTGVAGGVQMFSGQYATVALFSGDARLPGGAVAAWLSTLMQGSAVAAILFLILLFPTGVLLSPRWRILAWIAGLAIAASLMSFALRPGPLRDFPTARNLFGVEGATVILGAVEVAGGTVWFLCFVAAIVSLILRFYRSRGEERLQLKWFAYAAVLGFVAILCGGVLVPASLNDTFGRFVWTVAPLGLPVSAGIAILRYRLYDIDLIINRTLVYGSLTAALALVYLGGVVSLQYAFRALTGGESQLAVVASTLAIAALFVPLRYRVQGFVDRLFYRRKYDAAKTLQAFSTKLRDETDLDRLGGELVSVAKETVQPAHVSLWLREQGRSAQETEAQDGRARGGRRVPPNPSTSGQSTQARGGRP